MTANCSGIQIQFELLVLCDGHCEVVWKTANWASKTVLLILYRIYIKNMDQNIRALFFY